MIAELTPLVDVFVGSGGEGHTFPGAVRPWGLVSVSPHNTLTTPVSYLAGEPFTASGYLDGQPKIYGFGHTHISGAGCPDLGAPVVMATTGEVLTDEDTYASTYRDEVASPGYYATTLSDWNVRVESTATVRAGVTRFSFPRRNGDANVLFDVGRNLSWTDENGEVRVVSSKELEGWSSTGLFCAQNNQRKVFFVARFDRDADEVLTWGDDGPSGASSASGDTGAHFRFTTADGGQVEARVGVSFVSVDNARLNLEQETDGKSFDALRAEALGAWEQALGRVRVQGGSERDQRLLYTGLYHVLLHPNVLSDVNGEYPAMNGSIGRVQSGERYSTFSLWDTYRGVHPLLSLLYPEQQRDMVSSLAQMTAEKGAPPMWELGSYEVNMMVGDPANIVLAEAYLKGYRDFDAISTFEAMRDAALQTGEGAHRVGNASYLELGYIPMEEAEDVWGPVSTTLEYAYADYALSLFARELGYPLDADNFGAQAFRYRALFDAEMGLLRPKNRDGSWFEPFDPLALEGSSPVALGGPGYVEGTAYHYTYMVPHDVGALMELGGGGERFDANLQAIFDEGRFAMWNEPDLLYPWLFTAVGAQGWRTQEQVKRLREEHFSLEPDGLPGNDDAGALSAWLVFSLLGFYPVDPVSGYYVTHAPAFDRIELYLGTDTTPVVLEARGGDGYVVENLLDGEHRAKWLAHAELEPGAVVTFVRD